jgi:beta-mannosidase
VRELPQETVQLLQGWEATPLTAPLPTGTEMAENGNYWFSVPVPGHWQLLPGLAEYEGFMLYRCGFESAPPPPAGGMLNLRFGGVYYAARVWLNGEFLGSHEGYFAPFEFDCTDLVVRGPNKLLVEVYSPEEPDENDRRTLGGLWAKWDAMDPRINPGGIYRQVTLVHSGRVRIRSLGVEAQPSGECRAVAQLYSRTRANVTLRGRVRPLGFEAPGAEFEEDAQLLAGENTVEVPFILPEPQLWWTRDRGKQQLYELGLQCSGDEERVRFGVRSVELHSWHTYLNGQRVFLRGTNYLPTDAYPARASRSRFREDAQSLCQANLNSVRVHVHVAERAFYEACDELGLLVLQDFPLQWTHRRSVLKTAINQAAEMARLLRNHPSVGVYLIHDEPLHVVPPKMWTAPRLARMAVEAFAPRWALWQRRVLAPAVIKGLLGEDRSRPIIEAAGLPLTTNHLYFGWYYGHFRDLERVVKVFPGLSRLPTEYGAQALPDPESLEEVWPEGAEPPWTDLVENYCFQPERMRHYVPWRGDRAVYVRETQAYQAEVLKHATELFRRRKYRPTGGAFTFMFNDSAPAITWSVVDWRRRAKLGYEALRSAMSPALLCAEYPKESYRPGELLDLAVFLVNDFPNGLGLLTWEWWVELNGARIADGAGQAVIPPDSVTPLGRVRTRLPGPGRAALRLIASDERVAPNGYEFRIEQRSSSREASGSER